MTPEAPEDPKFSVNAQEIQSVTQIDRVDHLHQSIHYHQSSPDAQTLPVFLLPLRPEHFTNRDSELAELMDELHPGVFFTICGPGGMGKTALAVEAVYRFRDKLKDLFADGVIFHSFYQEPLADKALDQIARLFGEELKPTPAAAAQRVLSRRRLLLILDGAEDADDLKKILDVAGSCVVLITTRLRQDAPAGRQELAVLSPEDSRRLLEAWIKVQAADKSATKQISRLLGGLPLALRLAGKYMEASAQTPAEYLSWLEESGLDALDFGDHQLESVPKLIEHSLAQVSDLATEILGLAGVLSFASFAREPLAAALELTAPKLVSPLGELVNYGLLLRSGERYEVSHALIHTYTRKNLSPIGEVIERLSRFYLDFIKEKTKQDPDGYALLDTERVHILELLTVCVETKLFEPTIDIVSALDNYLDLQGYWLDRIRVLIAGVTAAKKLDAPRTEGGFLGNLGVAYRNLGQVQKAIEYFEQALKIHRKIKDRRGQGYNLGGLGLAYHNLGQVKKAIEYFEQALEINRNIKDRRGEGGCLANLGIVYRNLGQVQRSIEYFEQALKIHSKIGDRRGEGVDLGNLGNACLNLGQIQKAIKYFEQAQTIACKIGDRLNEGRWLGNLGIAYRNLGEAQKAIEYFEQALEIHRKIGNRSAEGGCLNNLGNAYSTVGQVETAINYYQQALEIHRKIHNRRGEGGCLTNLGKAYGILGQVQKAIEYFGQALEIHRKIGDRGAVGNCLTNLAIVYRKLGQVDTAKKYLKQSLKIFEELQFPQAETVRQWLEELDKK